MNFGIDFGTTSSSICYFNPITKKYSLLKKNNYYKIPSLIYKYNNKLFHKYSQNFIEINYFKRQINKINFLIDNTTELSNIIKFYLNYLKDIIILNYPNIKINSVFTVPTSYNHYHRSWYKNILTQIGFHVKRIISEPSAAAIAYYYFNPSQIIDEELILVIDLGGGTTDISLLNKEDDFYQVIYNKGYLYLGGNDFTLEIKQKLNLNNIQDAEKRKLLNDPKDKIYYNDTLKKLEKLLDNIYNDINNKVNNIKDVILVGNGLKLFGIMELLNKYFPNKLRSSKEQEYLVSYGAGILSHELENKSSELIIIDSTSLSLGIETDDLNFSVIIPANSPLPASGIRKYLPSDDNEDEISLTIYQGEHSLAQDNEIVGELIIPTNPNKYVDSIYQVKLTLDLNGIIMVNINDISDKTYHYNKILKFEKSNNIESLQKLNQDKSNQREFRRLKYEIKFISKQIILSLEESNLNKEEKDVILVDLENIYQTSYDYLSVIKNRKYLETNYGHLQYSKKECNNENLNDLIRIDNNDNDYSDNLTKIYLQEKIRNYLDLEKIILSPDLLEIVKNLINNFDNLELVEIQLKIKEIDNALNITSDYQEFKNLILEIEYELESDNIDINIKQKQHLLERIELEKQYIKKELKDIDYNNKIEDFNDFCKNI